MGLIEGIPLDPFYILKQHLYQYILELFCGQTIRITSFHYNSPLILRVSVISSRHPLRQWHRFLEGLSLKEVDDCSSVTQGGDEE